MGQGYNREENLPIQSRSYAGSHTKGEQLDHLEAPDVRWWADMTGGWQGLGWQGERGLGVRPSCFTLCGKTGSGHLPFPLSYMILLSLNSQLWLLVVFFSFLKPSSWLPFTPYSTYPFISKERPQASPSFGLDQTFALIWHFFTEPIHLLFTPDTSSSSEPLSGGSLWNRTRHQRQRSWQREGSGRKLWL